MNQTIGRLAARAAGFTLACTLAAGCSGNQLLPGAQGTAAQATARTPGAALATSQRSKRKVPVRMSMRIPRRERRHARRPATISSFTQSVAIAVDGGTPSVFNTTPTSSNCTTTATGRTCSFSIVAPVGTDAFAVTTYDAAGAGGHPLDYAVGNVPIAAGKNNTVPISLGPVVSNTADSGVGSLRYAIGSASDGDTILFLLPAGSTIALASTITIFKSITIAGPGASSLAISGGNSTELFETIGSVTISGVTLTQGSATGSNPGGDIVNAGLLTLANDVIGNSSSTASSKHAPPRHASLKGLHPHCATTYAYGGAIGNAGAIVSSGTTFTGNFVPSNPASCIEGAGGAIYNTVSGTISSTGDTFTGNSAYLGGAVYNDSAGSVTFTNDTFSGNTGCSTSSGCPTSGCSGSTCASFAVGEGAAIYDEGVGVTIVSSTFTNNVAGGPSSASVGQGGALYLAAGTPTITNSTFAGNLAGGGSAFCSSGEGGAILAAVSVEIDGSTFKSNRAVGDTIGAGGAIADTASSATITGTNNTFSSNQAMGSGSACTPTATGAGGAVYVAGAVALTGSTFTGNAASGNATAGAGAIICQNSCTLANDAFTSNSATATGAGSPPTTEASGGAIAGGNLVKVGGSTFTSNSVTNDGSPSAQTFGGAIEVDGATASLVSNGTTYSSNQVFLTTGTGVAAGGAISVNEGTFSSGGDAFTSNRVTSSSTAGAGAAIVAGTSTIVNSKFNSNSATGPTAIAGAVAVESTGDLINDTFAGNSATGTGIAEGGAIVDTGGSTIVDTTISQNAASSGGGGVISATSPEIIIDSIFTGNSVTNGNIANAGGGGLNEAAGATIEYSTFANNTVALNGGPGPAGGGGIYNSGGITLMLSTVSGNKVTGSTTGGGGGGIFNDNGASITNSTISGNTSSLDGGGIDDAANDTDTLENDTVFQNGAGASTGRGGNIYNLYALTLTNSIAAGGSAATGPDIDNPGTITSGDYNIIQTPVAGNLLTGSTAQTRTLDPKLLPLSNNGGPTFTNADQATSPGTAFIPFGGGNCGSISLATDQRGYTRDAGAKCDIGAYEFGGTPSAIRRRVPRTHRFALHPGTGLSIPRLLPAHKRPDPIFRTIL